MDAYFLHAAPAAPILRMVEINDDLLAHEIAPPGWSAREWAILAAGLGLPADADRVNVWRAAVARVRQQEDDAARGASDECPTGPSPGAGTVSLVHTSAPEAVSGAELAWSDPRNKTTWAGIFELSRATISARLEGKWKGLAKPAGKKWRLARALLDSEAPSRAWAKLPEFGTSVKRAG